MVRPKKDMDTYCVQRCMVIFYLFLPSFAVFPLDDEGMPRLTLRHNLGLMYVCAGVSLYLSMEALTHLSMHDK